MPSTVKRPSLASLLSSLRPSRDGKPSSFPIQTGFPTSLADLVVKNHGRLRKTRKPRTPDAPVPPPSTVAVRVEIADELTPLPSPARPLSPVATRRVEAAPRGGGAHVFRLRPELLALGGTVALALLAVWSEGTVAAFTVAALSLFWTESASRRRPLAEADPLPDSCVSPIREANELPVRSNCSDSDRECELPSPRTADSPDLASTGDDPTDPNRKGKRSLRKLISKKLSKKRDPKESSDSSSRSFEEPDAAGDAEMALKTESLVSGSALHSQAQNGRPSPPRCQNRLQLISPSRDRRGPGVKFPLAAFIPVTLTGLAAGKLPATALSVLCIVFSSVVQ